MIGVFLAIAGSIIIGWGDFQVSGSAFWGPPRPPDGYQILCIRHLSSLLPAVCRPPRNHTPRDSTQSKQRKTSVPYRKFNQIQLSLPGDGSICALGRAQIEPSPISTRQMYQSPKSYILSGTSIPSRPIPSLMILPTFCASTRRNILSSRLGSCMMLKS